MIKHLSKVDYQKLMYKKEIKGKTVIHRNPSVTPIATIFGPVGGPYRALFSKFVTDETQFDDSCKQVERVIP